MNFENFNNSFVFLINKAPLLYTTLHQLGFHKTSVDVDNATTAGDLSI